uniref:Uncharacterized protein n=1 Tax=Kalanchoe fedtschenkoi TaxID=63787 RepID=A0A7N0ZT81_KALFE
MGSLMAGWDSPHSNSHSVKFERNRSLTKEEINAYWSSRKKTEEEHLRSISSLSPRHEKVEATLYERSNSLPATNAEGEILGAQDINQTSLQKLQGWWTSSSSAFLNEPPVMALE